MKMMINTARIISLYEKYSRGNSLSVS